MSKMNKKQSVPAAILKPAIPMKLDPAECPFREFKDNELGQEYWGLDPGALRNLQANINLPGHGKGGGKLTSASFTDGSWHDRQVQPLPRSVRHYLDDWVSAEDLAAERWDGIVVVAEENKTDRMSVIDYQLSYTQVLLRSTFCRKVLAACYNLERVESLMVEHQWENFSCIFGPEGWRAKYHIYSPGTKPGGGLQHKPTTSKNGCYLVRLYYLGAWRCVWVSDLVPVDASGAPLLPFSPLSSPSPNNKGKSLTPMVTSAFVHLWPLLLCKAILKLAAPEMDFDDKLLEEDEVLEDEDMADFDILHCLTGGLSVKFECNDYDEMWNLLWKEVRVFSWDGEDELTSGTTKSKVVKKPNPKDRGGDFGQKRESLVILEIIDTKDQGAFIVPGITPAHAMPLYVSLIRDVPLKKPLPEPEIPLWKNIRWIHWARSRGLYDAYECPRNKFLKVTGLIKMSYAPHLLDVVSNESITQILKQEERKLNAQVLKQEDKKGASKKLVKETEARLSVNLQAKEELREWVMYDALQPFVDCINVVYYPSIYEYNSAGSRPPVRKTLTPGVDVPAPAAAPLYFQIDGPEENVLKISLSILHPRILNNCGTILDFHVEKAYLFLECFEWFKDSELPRAKAFVRTRSYDTVEIRFLPGRHYCRLWVHSPTHWHIGLLSESSLILGTRDVILGASVLECEWSTRFLSTLGNAFSNWVRNVTTSTMTFADKDREFYSSYQPDLTWDSESIGYTKSHLHWMFRKALQSHLQKRLAFQEYNTVCLYLRRMFCDPEFGFPPKPPLPRNLQEILVKEPCVCVIPEPEGLEEEEQVEEQAKNEEEKVKPDLVSPQTMERLLMEPEEPLRSHICDVATDELPCGVLKEERLKVIRKHEAATLIQANWRGYYARKCLSLNTGPTNELLKLMTEHIFGSFDTLSAWMNEFFAMFPGARYAFSVSSGLNGMRGLQQHSGTSEVTPACKWIPYFQGVFYCHSPVKAHFDIHSSLEHTSVQIYDNDSGEQLPQAYNAHITFHVEPNELGYTVMGHGSLNDPLDITHDIEVPWHFTILSSLFNVFHMCDNDKEVCTTYPLTHATKFTLDEMYFPNRRNILGAIQIAVNTVESISFRAEISVPTNCFLDVKFEDITSHLAYVLPKFIQPSSTWRSPNLLEIEAILRTTDADGNIEEIDRCSGKGEIFWPYVYLKPPLRSDGGSSANLTITSATKITSSRSLSKGSKSAKGAPKVVQSRSLTKLPPPAPKPLESKIYTIEVIAPEGWALPVHQWKRIDEIRNSPISLPLPEPIEKESKTVKATPPPKTGSAKSDKKKEEEKQKVEPEKPVPFVIIKPKRGDALTVFECSTSFGGGATIKRDDTRDILFATTVRNWNLRDPQRISRGAEIRQKFRDEYLVQAAAKSESISVSMVEGEFVCEEEMLAAHKPEEPVTTPAEHVLSEMAVEAEEESLYFTLPESIKDKFVPLHFVPESMRELVEEIGVLFTNEMMEAAKAERVARFDAAVQRMRELQLYNDYTVLEEQKIRLQRLNSLDIDDVWCDGLITAFEGLDAAVKMEIEKEMARLAAKKKQEQMAKEAEKQKHTDIKKPFKK